MEKKTDETEKKDQFPIVGIGASAGGLEALELFMAHVPVDSGMAFVVIQHLDPNHEDMMPELLQRITPMNVIQARDRLKVEPNSVYVIPPNKEMSILRGVLYLRAPSAPRGLRLPIDSFLRSLAEDQEQYAIGVILSGMGTDGTAGIWAIKEKAGLVLAQEPSQAKFGGMVHSAIATGLVDIIAPSEELPGRIISFLQYLPQIPAEIIMEEKSTGGLDKLLLMLRVHSGQDFSLYKKSTVSRRIERRMGLHHIIKVTDYLQFMNANPQELDLLFKELLIGVTNFFRDPPSWERLKTALPALLNNHLPGDTLRAWVPACSTGEEAYSLAIIFREALEEIGAQGKFSMQIFASDLDHDAIDRARQGLYPLNIGGDVSPERLNRYFLEEENGFRVNKEIREMVIFATQNIIMDPPFTRLDILSCRNLLIYLETDLQKKLIPLFHYSLSPGGILFLGNAETIGVFTDLFATIDNKSRLFRRLETQFQPEAVELPIVYFPVSKNGQGQMRTSKPAISLTSLADQIILQNFSPAAVLSNDRGDVLYINGRTGKYLEPASGKANWNIFAMAREGLRYELIGVFQKALHQKEPAISRAIKLEGEGKPQYIDLTVQRLEQPKDLAGMVLVVFSNVPEPPPRQAAGAKQMNLRGVRIGELEHELQQVREELRIAREEMQTSQEELQSANEELQSINEELQSTNEELTTSKEELQSLNEELQTVNSELQSKVDDLSQANNDLKNLLNNTDIATIFLDEGLNVRRFTSQSTKIINLIPGDVGRPFSDITTTLVYPALTEDAREVLRTLTSAEKQITARDGRWFTIRIMPYRTQDNHIDGVVMTFTDITGAKSLENNLRDNITNLQSLLEAIPVGMAVIDSEGRIVQLNPIMEGILGVKKERIFMESERQLSKYLHVDGSPLPAEELPSWKVLHGVNGDEKIEISVVKPDGKKARIQMNATPYPNGGAVVVMVELPDKNA